MDLSQQIIVITGSGGGVGSALVDYFHGKANHVVACRRSSEVNFNRESDDYSIITGNLSDRLSCSLMVATIMDHLGTIHGWLNVAGGFSTDGPVEKIPTDMWFRQVDINFITCLNACQAIWPVFKDRGFGRIINFGSIAGEQGMSGAGPYAMSKAGVHSLTKTLALEGGGNVSANVIVPSIIDTPNNRASMPEADFSAWTKTVDIAQTIERILTANVNPPNGELFHL